MVSRTLKSLAYGGTLALLSCTGNSEADREEADTDSPAADVVVAGARASEVPDAAIEANREWADSLTESLSGIERYILDGSLLTLQSLMISKGDDEAELRLETLLGEMDERPNGRFIQMLDPEAGYGEASSAVGETYYTVTYWRVSDGSHLIATESRGCGPACSSELSFSRFDGEVITPVDIAEVMPDTVSVREMLVPDPEPEPYELLWLLPRQGKDIRYCLYHGDGDCVELLWRDGSFTVGDVLRR